MTNRVDVVGLTTSSRGQFHSQVDVYMCETVEVRWGALVLGKARLELNRPGDLHDLIVLPLEQIASATVNATKDQL